MNRQRKQVILITCLILLFIFICRLPYLSHSPFEAGESWRQGDTESMARNFVNDRFHLLFPQLNYDGAPPNYAQLEFQLTTFLIAILYKIFGFHYELARLIPSLFFVGSAYFLFLLTKKYYSLETAWVSMVLYSLLPLNLFFSRAIMPESAALFFFIGCFYFFCQWLDHQKFHYLLISAIMTALAISIKTPTIFIGLPMLILSLIKFKTKIFFRWQLWTFASVSLLPPFIYFKWLDSVAEFKFVTGIGMKHIIPKFTTAIISTEALSFFKIHLPQSFSWTILLLFVIGVFLSRWKNDAPIQLWLLAMFLELITIVAVIRFNYYLIFFTPVVALFSARALVTIMPTKNRHIRSFQFLIILIIVGWMNFASIQEKWVENHTLLKQAEVVKQFTEKEDLIVVGTFSPDLINASELKGWRANIDYYDHIPKGPEAEIHYFITNGAKYFVPNKGYIYGDDDQQYRQYLNEHFEKIQIKGYEEFYFYKLQ